MDRSATLALPAGLVRRADRLLRLAGDVRLAMGMLLVAALANAVAAAAPGGTAVLASPPYVVLLGAILLSGIAGVAVRTPVAWREWRIPGAVPEGRETLVATADTTGGPGELAARLRRAGYRVVATDGPRWAVHGTRRGWTRFAGLGAHIALVVTIIGAALGTAFASETTFSLLPGEEAFLEGGTPGVTDALRFEALDAAFGADGRPTRLDTSVTFLRDGAAVQRALIQVNAPGSFGSYLVHAWTYGPAARLRVTTLGGSVLHDGPLALDASRDGRPAALLDLPTRGESMAVVLADATDNTVAVSAGTGGAPSDAALLRPGQEARLGDLRVRLDGFTSWVTFLARRDPGMAVLFTGAALLVACLVVTFWLPRRRLSVRPAGAGVRIALRGERFDLPAAEMARIRAILAR
jgi:cytochrome c biogenesis protein